MKMPLTVLQSKKGSVLAFIALVIIILSILGLGLLTISYGVRFHASKIQNEAIALLAAEAGYEKAVFWMGQQTDMVYVMKAGGSYSDSISLPNGGCDYQVSFFSFIGSRPTYRIISNGYSGRFKRTVDVLVVQAIGGWDMGLCRIPSGAISTDPVFFANGEVIDMPIHINKAKDSPDSRDIFVTGDPQFLENVSMGESRYTSGGSDKYAGVMDVFDEGIDFDQPSSRITDESVVQKKIERFKDTTKVACIFMPVAKASVTNPVPAVQLEFFVDGSGVGNVRITNNCTVRGFMQENDSRTRDFKVKSGTNGGQYERYNIYSYHFMPQNADATGERVTRPVESTYVTQTIGGAQSEPGGQIFVDGNVIIGGNNTLYNNGQVVKGKITVVATGNIWVADSIVLDGAHDASGIPSQDNPNALGLISQGVVKVVDPGMTEYSYVDGQPLNPSDSVYVPVGVPEAGQPVDSYKRYLPDPMVVEASITVGGGGWGAENVQRLPYGGRKEFSGDQDDLVVRGTITEVIRGIVGQIGADGFLKHYYFDRRFLEGILPGDMWLRGKYVPAPAGWRDYETIE
jgi:hypothetical protein